MASSLFLKSSFPNGAPLDKTKFSLQVVINWELMKLNFNCIQLLNPFDLLIGLVLLGENISLLAQAGLELVALHCPQWPFILNPLALAPRVLAFLDRKTGPFCNDPSI